MPRKRRYYKGKRVSRGELKIAEVLDKNNIDFIQEHSFADLVSKKGNRLRFDFFISDFNLVIEYQGQHHYRPVNKHRRAQRTHKLAVLHDSLKMQYCDRNHIRILRIPYENYDRIEEVLNIIINAFNKNKY